MSKPVDLNFSIGLMPKITFRDKNYTITPVFSLYDTSYKFYNDLENIYIREVNMINTGLIVSFGDYKKGVDLSYNFLYTEPKKNYEDTSRIRQYQLKIAFSFYTSTKYETYNYIPPGVDFWSEVAFFTPGVLCYNLSIGHNKDIFSTDIVNSHRAWRIINSSKFNIKSIIWDENAGDYVISRYCLSSMFAAYPGVCDINRLSIHVRDNIMLLSPYFSNDNVAWYLSAFIEMGAGLFGEVGSTDYSKSAFRLSSSLETGFRIKGITNLYARFTYFYPDNPSIKASFYFSIDLS